MWWTESDKNKNKDYSPVWLFYTSVKQKPPLMERRLNCSCQVVELLQMLNLHVCFPWFNSVTCSLLIKRFNHIFCFTDIKDITDTTKAWLMLPHWPYAEAVGYTTQRDTVFMLVYRSYSAETLAGGGFSIAPRWASSPLCDFFGYYKQRWKKWAEQLLLLKFLQQ